MRKKSQKVQHLRFADSHRRFMIESDNFYRDLPIAHEVC